MSPYHAEIKRLFLPELHRRLARAPAVALLGPRQVGKTTLAFQIAADLGARAVYLDLELPSDLAKISDPEHYLSSHEDKLVILDEIQRLPGLFATLRGIIDKRRRKGQRSHQFLLLGSASMQLLKQSTESLAGRITYLEMTPFQATEVSPGLETLWTRGGFPESYLAPSDTTSFAWREAFIRTYLERDIPELGPRIPSTTLRRFWQMLAHNHGQLHNAAPLAASLAVSGHTIARYLDLMVELFLVRRLMPWTSNDGKRFVRSPKVYIRDTGLLHALLGIQFHEDLLGHPITGASWEGFIVENILAALPAGVEAFFYRSSAGAEIDLVLAFPRKVIWAIEIKRSVSSPQPSKGFHFATADLKAKRRFVVYPGKESYSLLGNIEVLPLPAMIERLAGSVKAQSTSS